MNDDLTCPVCTMADLLEGDGHHECITCGHEWAAERVVTDANGNVLVEGDSVTLIKGLKVKGGSPLKVGTKVTNIRLAEGDHELDCKVDGQLIMIKAMYVKKA